MAATAHTPLALRLVATAVSQMLQPQADARVRTAVTRPRNRPWLPQRRNTRIPTRAVAVGFGAAVTGAGAFSAAGCFLRRRFFCEHPTPQPELRNVEPDTFPSNTDRIFLPCAGPCSPLRAASPPRRHAASRPCRSGYTDALCQGSPCPHDDSLKHDTYHHAVDRKRSPSLERK